MAPDATGARFCLCSDPSGLKITDFIIHNFLYLCVYVRGSRSHVEQRYHHLYMLLFPLKNGNKIPNRITKIQKNYTGYFTSSIPGSSKGGNGKFLV